MSGGAAYVYDPDGTLESRCNTGLVSLEKVSADEDVRELRRLIENHRTYTGSDRAGVILDAFDAELANFVKVIPNDYKRVTEIIATEQSKGANRETAILTAFETVAHKKVAM